MISSGISTTSDALCFFLVYCFIGKCIRIDIIPGPIKRYLKVESAA
jgi:hypothetical protein